MSSGSNETYMSMELKRSNSLTAEEERDHYRQRFQSMKLVLKEYQQQLTLYKTRCAGVDTVALMLKESKDEVTKLTRQCKALETVVTNLQNRLVANGLSSRVNLEETDVFVPGASKQTLDNLARENARLRSLLKNAEGQGVKKPSEELQSLKASLENMEGENNQLRAQLLDMENLKMTVVAQYEETIKKLKGEFEKEKQQLEQELNQYFQGDKSVTQMNEDNLDAKKASVGCQTTEVGPTKIEELKKALKQLSEQCLQVDSDLENVHTNIEYEKKEGDLIYEKQFSKITEEAYSDMEKKLSQVIEMNQRWQTYNDNQEQQTHALFARISELEELSQEGEKWQREVQARDIENQRLKREIDNLTLEVNRRKSQPQVDSSMIEILKQQIQVCTEDFNTERKDRELAVNKMKMLHDENTALKKEIENLKKWSNPMETSMERREFGQWNRPQPPVTQFKARGQGQNVFPQRIPLSLSSSLSPSSTSLSPVPSPSPMSMSSINSGGERVPSFAPSSQESVAEFQGPPQHQRQHQVGRPEDFLSLPRHNVVGGGAISPGVVQNPPTSNVSMPAISRKRSDQQLKDRGPCMTCPKCGKEFSDDQLLSHIDSCTD